MKRKAPVGLAVRAFARELGVTESCVRQGIASGRIPPSCVALRTVGNGRRWPVITDPDRAARHWRDSRNPAQVRPAKPRAGRSAKPAPRGRAARTSRAAPAASTPGEPEETSAIEAMLAAGKLPTIEQSQRVINAYKARTSKLEHDQRAGELVNKADVAAEYAAMVVTTRNKLLGIPAKAKARAPDLTVEHVQLLDELIREALEALANGQE